MADRLRFYMDGHVPKAVTEGLRIRQASVSGTWFTVSRGPDGGQSFQHDSLFLTPAHLLATIDSPARLCERSLHARPSLQIDGPAPGRWMMSTIQIKTPSPDQSLPLVKEALELEGELELRRTLQDTLRHLDQLEVCR